MSQTNPFASVIASRGESPSAAEPEDRRYDSVPVGTSRAQSMPTKVNPFALNDADLADDNDSAMWVCASCTYDNEGGASECEMCEAPREVREDPVPGIGDDVHGGADDSGDVNGPRRATSRRHPGPVPAALLAAVAHTRQPSRGRLPPDPNAGASWGAAASSNSFVITPDSVSADLGYHSGGSSQSRPTSRERAPHHLARRSNSVAAPGDPRLRAHPNLGTFGRRSGVKEFLVCEGRLLVRKKPQWAVLTSKKLVTYSGNAGELISSVFLDKVSQKSPVHRCIQLWYSFVSTVACSQRCELEKIQVVRVRAN